LQEYLLQAAKTNNYVQLKQAAGARKGMPVKNASRQNGLRQQRPYAPPSTQVDVMATVRHFLIHDKVEVIHKREQIKTDLFVFFLLDSSGSMIKDKQIAYVKGLVEETIARYKTRRIRYAALALHNGTAQLLAAPTLSAGDLLTAIGGLKTGGKTNMQAGFALLHQLMKTNVQQKTSLYIFTDGKINAGQTTQPFEEAVSYYKQYLSAIKQTTIINTESGFVKLGLAGKLAQAIKANQIRITHS
jgi:magnesium chelatase subunit ChlD-like protein